MSEAGVVIEGEAEEVGAELVPAAPEANNVVLFGTSDPVEVVTEATRVANALADVIQDKGLFSTIQRRNHVKVEGWQLLGSMLGVTAVCTDTERTEDGFSATVEARAGDGRVVGRATALCTRKERQWKKRDDYALLSMAQTRATSKALKGPLGFVVSLAGYQTTPAEEMSHDQAPAEPNVPAPDAPPAEELLEHAKNCGLKSAHIIDWIRRNADPNLPNPEGIDDLLAAIGRLDGAAAAKFTTDATQYATASAAAAREASLAHEAEEEAG